MVFEGTHFLPINSNSHYFVSSNDERNNTIVSLRKITIEEVYVKCYDFNDNLPYYLRTMPQNDFSSLSYLNVPTEEHDNIMKKTEQNRRH